MAPSLRDHIRPSTRENRPATRDHVDASLIIPSRTSSLHSRITQPMPACLNTKPSQRAPKTLTHAYMVCGVGREPSQWVKAPATRQGKIQHMKCAVGQFWLPEILGSSPRMEQDNEMAKSLHAAMRACFPHDVELVTGRSQPQCLHHSFVLQQDSQHTLYGIALRVWSRADEKRAETIRDLRRKTETDYRDSDDDTYWIPYCLSFLSRYPLYNLLGDYLRGMWIHWNKATNLFHAEEISRILSFPAPRLNDLVRIDMKDFALCYQFPSSPTGFQNFSMWPLFQCLGIPNIVGVVEAALSPTRRIIFQSHYPAMLTVAAETIRFCVRVFEWSGLYVPVVYGRHVNDLVQEPGPYILGITAECRSLYTAPTDALVVDLDRNYVLTSNPPNIITPGQRSKMIQRLSQALNADVPQTGVPGHLRMAFNGGKLIPAGQIVVVRGEVDSIQDPQWWNQDAVMNVMDHVCEKLGRNTGVKAIFGGTVKKPLMAKVSMRHLNELQRERNQYSRDTLDAWQDFINLKGRMDTEVSKTNKRNNYLESELETWKGQFLKFQAFVEQLNREVAELRVKIESHKRENKRLTGFIDQQKDDAARLSLRLSGTERQRDQAMEALVLQQGIAEDLERERSRNKKVLDSQRQNIEKLSRQRDEALRCVLHLRALIDGNTHHMEHLVRSISTAPDAVSIDEEEIEGSENGEEKEEETEGPVTPAINRLHPTSKRHSTAVDSLNGDFKAVTPSMEKQLLTNRYSNRYSTNSMSDVADKHLKEKTDAIAYIIRSISEQCAAAVQGLELARQEVEEEEEVFEQAEESHKATPGHVREDSNVASELAASEDGHLAVDSRSNDDNGHLTPASEHSSIPPTPELMHQRSSTALSMASTAPTTVTDRSSLQNQRAKIAQPEESIEKVHGDAEEGTGSVSGEQPAPTKQSQNGAPTPVPTVA